MIFDINYIRIFAVNKLYSYTYQFNSVIARLFQTVVNTTQQLTQHKQTALCIINHACTLITADSDSHTLHSNYRCVEIDNLIKQ